ncbi:EndoU domain-containing protein [Chryseobacterium sp. Leaf180]|uniref:EndoU domain-containing protein n=1 Tax=Chryseobacterium sp. Leaf180 TaxID=1736289 RepID=UPI0009E9FBB2
MEELGEFTIKKDKHTFFPKQWDLEKIKRIVKEASENITFSDGNKFQGMTKNGIEIEFFIDKNTREIQTAYIIFKN